MEQSETSKLSYVYNANIKRWALFCFFFAIGKNQHVTSRNEECEWRIDATVID